MSRSPHALGGSGLEGTGPLSPALQRAGAAGSSLPRGRAVAGRARAPVVWGDGPRGRGVGIAELFGIRP